MAKCCPSSKFLREARHLITIQRRIETPDTLGGFASTWTTVTTAYAVLQPIKPSELFIDQRLENRHTHKVTIRYQDQFKNGIVTGTYRFLYDDRTFSIDGVSNVDQTMKYEGRQYQILAVIENDAEVVDSAVEFQAPQWGFYQTGQPGEVSWDNIVGTWADFEGP